MHGHKRGLCIQGAYQYIGTFLKNADIRIQQREHEPSTPARMLQMLATLRVSLSSLA